MRIDVDEPARPPVISRTRPGSSYARAVSCAGAFFDAGKPVAAICHAPWILTEIGVLQGRTMTSWPTLQTDLRNAGATWVDREVVVDTNGGGTLITSRKPDDVPASSRELIEAV